MDYKSKAIYADSLVVISLELYLGKNHKFYQFPNYLKQNFEQRQIAPDIVSVLQRKQPVVEKDLLSQMIYHGKQLYLKDLFCQTIPMRKMYSPKQIALSRE
jgi:hypothetical protein